MRGLKLVQNGVITYAPYNEATIAFYEERNRLLRGVGSAKQVEETVSVFNATESEVKAHLLADVVPSTAGIPTLPNPQSDISQFMSALLQQQSEIAELKAMLANKVPVEQPVATTDISLLKKKPKKSPSDGISDDELTEEILQDI